MHDRQGAARHASRGRARAGGRATAPRCKIRTSCGAGGKPSSIRSGTHTSDALPDPLTAESSDQDSARRASLQSHPRHEYRGRRTLDRGNARLMGQGLRSPQASCARRGSPSAFSRSQDPLSPSGDSLKLRCSIGELERRSNCSPREVFYEISKSTLIPVNPLRGRSSPARPGSGNIRPIVAAVAWAATARPPGRRS